MDLVERYIAAVKFWLPANLKEDIGAELFEDIRSEIEEAEHEKGRKLTDDEIAELLKARGAPLSVASRYLPQKSLIGPELFPVYILVLKIMAVLSLIPALIVGINTALFGPDYFPLHTFTNPISNLLSSFAIVTIVFAIIEHKGVIRAKQRDWNPKTLPHVQPANRHIKRSEAVGDITGSLVLVWLFFADFLSKTEYSFPGWHIVVSPEWVPYWQIVLSLALAETVFAAFQLFRPYWSFPTILMRMLFDITKIGLLGWLLSTHVLRQIEINGLPVAAATQFLQASDQLAIHAIQLAAVLIGCVVLAATVRFARSARGPMPVDA